MTHDNGAYVNPYTPTVGDKAETVAYYRSGGPHYGDDATVTGVVCEVYSNGAVLIEFTDNVGPRTVRRQPGNFGVLR